MVDHLMFKLVQAIVGLERISVERGTGLDMLAYFGLKRFFLYVRNNRGPYPATTFQDAHNGGFVFYRQCR